MASNADLFATLPDPDATEHAGGFDEAPWYIQRFIRSICDMRDPWIIHTDHLPPPKEDDDDE